MSSFYFPSVYGGDWGATKKPGEKENTSNGEMRADVGQRAEEALNQTVDVGSADNTCRDYLCCLLFSSGEGKKKYFCRRYSSCKSNN